jgi:hypothetical protein
VRIGGIDCLNTVSITPSLCDSQPCKYIAEVLKASSGVPKKVKLLNTDGSYLMLLYVKKAIDQQSFSPK